ncbi:PEX5-related protein [Hippoglossus stenolepis]|uniref:PEX5-related protein n=1 Tax=Hippoglossus stenolepis TaxID=195615 RepID=UPI001FAE800E|nr:PEX5-related protein [Hippoglossus stenolepis]
MYQVQGKGERVVAMVLKELPGKKASSEGNPLLTVTTKLVSEQQESRPLLSPSIDDFLSESRSDAASSRPLTSNTAASVIHTSDLLFVSVTETQLKTVVECQHDEGHSDRCSSYSFIHVAFLSTAQNLVDLSEPGEVSGGRRRSPLRRKGSSMSPRRRACPEETELIQVEVDHLPVRPRTPERVSLDSVSVSSPLDKWEEVNLDVEDGGRRRRHEKKCTSHHSSSELLWSAEFKTDPVTKNVHSFTSSPQVLQPLLPLQYHCTTTTPTAVPLHNHYSHCSTTAQPLLPLQNVGRPDRRQTRCVLTRNESQEDEFVRAKAAVESDTEFWDKMQAEWEELARRNWLEESEGQQPIPPSVSPVEKGYYFNTTNPYREWTNAFAEGQEKARDGDLNAAVLLLEAAILQDPLDSEAWQLLGTTQAENENEQAAIVSLQRCLELQPNNLLALMALAVSFTNSSMQREACDALRRWIRNNPRYKHLGLEHRSPLQGSPATPRRGPHTFTSARCELQSVLLLFQEAVLFNLDSVDPDLQTGLGVLFNLSSDFNKAVEAFTAALSVRPQDYRLWNRLGATLANGNRSEEAVEAYSRALELQPGFIRSRYNLGISCINLGAHREAVSNFLTALNQQRRSQRCSHQQMSANIWAALRIAISMMDQPELFQAANVGDLDLLMRAFDVGDI